jgi:hypothetical protein
MYQLLKQVLFRFDPEMVHDFFVRFGRVLGSTPLTRGMVRVLCDFRHPSPEANRIVKPDAAHRRREAGMAKITEYPNHSPREWCTPKNAAKAHKKIMHHFRIKSKKHLFE